MALKNQVKQKYVQYAPRENGFYRDHYHHMIYGLMAMIFVMMIAVFVLLYQTLHRPLPVFRAMDLARQQMVLTPFEEPNLLPSTLLRWTSKAAITAYTFNFNQYSDQLDAARPYFTEIGWQDYITSITPLINSIIQNQLFVYGVVAGVPVISNKGPLPGKGQAWRIQIPFLVSYASSEKVDTRKYFVVITLIRVPTSINPQGVGIDQFVMSPRN